jgi:hypothetical protein
MPKTRTCAGYAAALRWLFAFFFLLQLTSLSAQNSCAEMFKDDQFPSDVVNSILRKFRVPSDKWSPINRDLARQMTRVESIAREKGAQLTPNPFDPPQQTVVIGRLYREAEREVFRQVMEQNGVEGERDIHEMFDEIQYEKAAIIWQCFRERQGR